MRIVKDILKRELLYPRIIKRGVSVYEGPETSALTSYLTIFKILKDKFPPEFKDVYLDFFIRLKERLVGNVREHFSMPDSDTQDGSNEACLGFNINSLTTDLLFEFRRIVVYLEYGKKEPRESLFAYANRYFKPETFFASYVDGFCYFAQNPFSDYGHFYLKDKTVGQLTPVQISQGIKYKLFTLDEIKGDLNERITHVEADLKALKSIVKQSLKGDRRGRKN